MKSNFLNTEFTYDGTQLCSLYSYLNHNMLGDSIVSWVGPCHIDFAHMVDGEDLLVKAKICGDKMLHFIIEKFDANLFSGVLIQRLFTSICIEALKELSPNTEIANALIRSGDDIYFQKQKLSISVATKSPVSTLIHFAVNVTNSGTPVPTLSLEDLAVAPKDLATVLINKLSLELENVIQATQKVKWVK